MNVLILRQPRRRGARKDRENSARRTSDRCYARKSTIITPRKRPLPPCRARELAPSMALALRAASLLKTAILPFCPPLRRGRNRRRHYAPTSVLPLPRGVSSGIGHAIHPIGVPHVPPLLLVRHGQHGRPSG